MRTIASARPGSTRWLIQHELLLAWRGMDSRRTVSMVVLAVLWLGLHVVAYRVFQHWSGAADTLRAWITLALGGATWVVIGLMLAGAISGSVAALFDRGDLDLLLSSPLPARTVFMVRGLGIAADVAKTLLFLLAPAVDVGLLFGYWNLLATYLALPALALSVTALGMGLCLVLVRVLGARRTRSLGMTLGAVAGTGLILTIQVRQVLDANATGRLIATLIRWAGPNGPLAPDSLWWLPSQAMAGAPLPLLIILVTGPVAFWLTVRLAHRRFLAGTQEAVTGSNVCTLAPPDPGSIRFKEGPWRATLMKEWRLIRREPVLIFQALMQLAVVAVPAGYMTVNKNAGMATLAPLLGPIVVYLATSLANNLAWITVAAEDVPDLLRIAPTSLSSVRWAKALAALLPTWLLAIPFLVLLASINLSAVPGLVLCLLGSTTSAAATHVWYPVQARRVDLARRKPARGVVTVIAAFVTFAWVVSAFYLIDTPVFALPSVLAAALGCYSIRLLGHTRRDNEPNGRSGFIDKY